VPWINQRIRVALADDQGLRQSDDRRRRYARDVQASLNEGIDLDQAIETVARSYRVKPSTIQGVFDAIRRPRATSLSAPIGEQGDVELLDTIAADTPRADEQLAIEEARRHVKKAVDRVRSQIGSRDRVVLDTRIFAADEATLQTIADRLSLSRSRIQQIEKTILDRLKNALTERRCSLCKKLLRQHNHTGICSSHGRSRTFDAKTGVCLVCGVTVSATKRAVHARLHKTGGPLPRARILEHGRARTQKLRDQRRSRGLCQGCGQGPPIGSLCATCLIANREASERRRRHQGHQPRPLLTIGGESCTIAEWSRRTGIPISTLWGRLVTHGWPPDRILEPVKSMAKRQREKTACVHGHPLTPENVWIYPKTGSRHCRTCWRERARVRQMVPS
jgi:RNA polymerase sigma factor (sigma-70 family)